MTNEPTKAELPETPCDDLVAILGRPNFACISLANILRKGGREIPNKSEDEQAHVILFLLRHWMDDKEIWKGNAAAELEAMLKDTNHG